METINDTAKIRSYHAHVYYSGADSRFAAASLREALQQRYEVAMGHWHDQPIGPHPLPMYQVSFAASEFTRVVPWLISIMTGSRSWCIQTPTTDTATTPSMRCGSARGRN